ncbi:MAG: c-type cytochrome [Candidatus Methylomirabilales bacterium]
MKGVNLKISLFALAVIGVYTYYANSIPQIESRPPEEVTVKAEELSPQALVALGEKIVSAKGGCLVCHAIGQPGQRAPDLAGIGARAAMRKPGMSAPQYLIESLVNPQAYVVEGYPPIMPPADKPPIGLNRTELLAVVAYLQSLGGEVTVKPEEILASVAEAPTGSLAPPSASPAPAPPTPGVPPPSVPLQPSSPAGTLAQPLAAGEVVGDLSAGKELIKAKGCIACHKVNGEGGAPPGAPPLGPDLSDIGARKTPEEIRAKILDPNAWRVPGFLPIMPSVFGEQLKAKEFQDLVAYLASLKGEKKP